MAQMFEPGVCSRRLTLLCQDWRIGISIHGFVDTVKTATSSQCQPVMTALESLMEAVAKVLICPMNVVLIGMSVIGLGYAFDFPQLLNR